METVKKKMRLILNYFIPWLLLAGIVCLTGCTGKELEQRRFPLALEVDSVQNQIVLACAWPGEEGGETGELGGGKSGNGEGMEIEEEETVNGEETKKLETGAETQADEMQKEEPGEKAETEGRIRNTNIITRVSGSTIQEAVETVQALQDKYVDYSQVKAILWGAGLEKDPGQAQQVKDWLEKTPAFARNLLIFDEKETGLDLETVQEQSKGQAGAYLENIYENQKPYRGAVCMLQDLLYGEG